MEIVWITRKHSVRSRTLIHSGFDERVEQDIRNKDKVVDGVPPTDG